MSIVDTFRRWLGIELAWNQELEDVRNRQDETRQTVMDASMSARSLDEAVSEEEKRVAKRLAERRMQASLDSRREPKHS